MGYIGAIVSDGGSGVDRRRSVMLVALFVDIGLGLGLGLGPGNMAITEDACLKCCIAINLCSLLALLLHLCCILL